MSSGFTSIWRTDTQAYHFIQGAGATASGSNESVFWYESYTPRTFGSTGVAFDIGLTGGSSISRDFQVDASGTRLVYTGLQPRNFVVEANWAVDASGAGSGQAGTLGMCLFKNLSEVSLSLVSVIDATGISSLAYYYDGNQVDVVSLSTNDYLQWKASVNNTAVGLIATNFAPFSKTSCPFSCLITQLNG